MAIEFISGPPRNGKSLVAVRQLIEVIVTQPDRYIATNLALDIPRLCEYLHQTYGDTCNAAQRIRLLTDMEASEFWLYPYRDVDLRFDLRIRIVRRGEMTKDVVDISSQRAAVGGKSVTFIIDEIHQYFGHREFASTGTDCLHYLSQHAKLGDDVIAITQAVENVDKQFQRVAQCFHYCQNRMMLKVPGLGGLFRAPGEFVMDTFLKPKGTKGGETVQNSISFKLDAAGVASCYRTASGVGIVGSFADKAQFEKGGKYRKGIPFWVFPVLLAVVAICAIKLPGYVIRKAVGVVAKPGEKQSSQTNLVAPAFVQAAAAQAGAALPIRPAVPAFQRHEETAVSEVGWTTKVKLPSGRWLFGLSDGRTFYSDDLRLRAVGRDAIQLGTNIYRWGESVGRGDRHTRIVPGLVLGDK